MNSYRPRINNWQHFALFYFLFLTFLFKYFQTNHPMILASNS